MNLLSQLNVIQKVGMAITWGLLQTILVFLESEHSKQNRISISLLLTLIIFNILFYPIYTL